MILMNLFVTLASLPACSLMSSLFGVTLALPHR